MTFGYDSPVEEDRARALSGLVKDDGLWKSDRQAMWATHHFPIRVNAYYEYDEATGERTDLKPEYDDGASRGVTLESGQIFTSWSGSVIFQVSNMHGDYPASGRIPEGGMRPVERAYVVDGIGIVRELKIHFRRDNGRWLPNLSKTEVLFERTASGPDHWATAAEAKAKRDAERAAEDEAAEEAPTGRVEVKGVVLSTKYQDSEIGSTKKMLVLTEAGWKLWPTVPRARLETDAGDANHIKVTVTPSDDDAKFAFGKRPAEMTKCGDGCEWHKDRSS